MAAVNEALALGRDVFVLSEASEVISAYGPPDQAEALIAELEERWPQNTVVQGGDDSSPPGPIGAQSR